MEDHCVSPANRSQKLIQNYLYGFYSPLFTQLLKNTSSGKLTASREGNEYKDENHGWCKIKGTQPIILTTEAHAIIIVLLSPVANAINMLEACIYKSVKTDPF